MSRRFCVSEAEALTKWCPAARFHPEKPGTHVQYEVAHGSANRFHPLTAGEAALASCKCLGSGCMWWRWAETHVDGRDADGVPALMVTV